jgi:hypothetical protein
VTEENDSVAIVVSEETGIISLVIDGDIERGVDAEQLRARLKALSIPRASAQGGREARYSFS